MQRSHRLAFVLGGFAVALAVLGGAYAASGGGNQTNRPTAHSPAIVAGTSAGMPVTAQAIYAGVNPAGTIPRGLPRTGAGPPTGTPIAIRAYALHFFHDI